MNQHSRTQFFTQNNKGGGGGNGYNIYNEKKSCDLRTFFRWD